MKATRIIKGGVFVFWNLSTLLVGGDVEQQKNYTPARFQRKMNCSEMFNNINKLSTFHCLFLTKSARIIKGGAFGFGIYRRWKREVM